LLAKTAKKALFFGHPFSIEIQTLSSIISLKRAEFLVLAGIAVLFRNACCVLRMSLAEAGGAVFDLTD
jgi:hypothetical protein